MNLDDLGRRAGAELQSDAVAGADGLPSADALVRRAGQRRSARVAASSFLVVAALVGAVALAGVGDGGDDTTQQVAAEGDGAHDPVRPASCDAELDASVDAAAGAAAEADRADASISGRASVAAEASSCVTRPTTPTTDPPPSTIDRDLPPCDVGAPTTFAFAPGECLPVVPSTTTSIVRPPSTSTSTSIAPPTPSPPPSPSTSSTSTSLPPGGQVTVRGRVTAGPVCPVEQVPPAPGCADIGIVANITFTPVTAPGAVVPQYAIVATSAADGTYSVQVPRGRWSIAAASTQAMSCETVVVDVVASRTIDISCDTGIR